MSAIDSEANVNTCPFHQSHIVRLLNYLVAALDHHNRKKVKLNYPIVTNASLSTTIICLMGTAMKVYLALNKPTPNRYLDYLDLVLSSQLIASDNGTDVELTSNSPMSNCEVYYCDQWHRTSTSNRIYLHLNSNSDSVME